MLDLIGKATPGMFRPALQIDPAGARLLIEALSGRWSYESERRRKRTVWYHVANVFPLLVSSIEPALDDKEIEVLLNCDRDL